MIPDRELALAVFRRPDHVINNHDGKYMLSVRVFGLQPGDRQMFDNKNTALFNAVTKNLTGEAGVKVAMARATDILGREVPSLVDVDDPTANLDHQQQEERLPWLRNAAPSMRQSSGSKSIEVDFFALIRDFTTHVSIASLAGADFLRTNPAFIHDLFTFDHGFPLLALNVPRWLPIPLLRKVLAARERMHAATYALHRRMEAVLDGTANAETRRRCDGVSGLFWDRQAIFREGAYPRADRAALDFSMFWAMNANTSPFVFWVLAYIYAHPNVLREIRTEVEPHVKVIGSAPGLPPKNHESSASREAQHSGPSMTVDGAAILKGCPHLRAAYLESFRLANQPTSLRRAESPIEFNLDSLRSDPKSTAPATFMIPRHTFMTVPYKVAQLDPKIYPDPEAFKPERFLVRCNASEYRTNIYEGMLGEQEKREGDDGLGAVDAGGEWKVVTSGLQPWGQGSAICKGRVFAEREVLLIVAMIVAVWDVEPVERTESGQWKLPGKIPGSGMTQPSKPVRVRVSRRASK